MIHYLTFGILATTSAARILAFVSNTRFVRRTVRVKNAFWATSFVRITVVLRQTLTRTGTILLSAIGIWAAGIGNTRCGLLVYGLSLDCAQSERIANISGQTDTHRSVTNNATLGILCTWIWTWILAFIVDASKVASAFGIRNAFGSTVWCRANKARQTWARRWISDSSTFRIRATRWRLARIDWVLDWLLNYQNETKKFVGLFPNRMKSSNWDLLIGWHITNGFPVYRFGQLQIGLCVTTIHFAPIPQVPIQGSRHFWLEHASVNGQSEFTVHSGRQVGGLPI